MGLIYCQSRWVRERWVRQVVCDLPWGRKLVSMAWLGKRIVSQELWIKQKYMCIPVCMYTSHNVTRVKKVLELIMML